MVFRPALSAVLCSMVILASCEKKPETPDGDNTGSNLPANNPDPALGTNTPEDPPTVEIDQSDFIRFGVKKAPPIGAGLIRVASYNIENLFDDIDDPALSDRYEDIDDTKPIHELEGVSKAIHDLDADVLAVQEVESLDALLAFRDEYLSDMGYQHVVSLDAGDERGIEQAVLSRFPVIETEQWVHGDLGGTHPELYGSQPNWHAGKPIVFHRSPLMVTVEVPAAATGGTPYHLSLIVLHHKSGQHSGYWREREAAGVMEIVEAYKHADPSRNLLVLGDFNALTTDASVQTYLNGGLRDLFADRTGDEIVTHSSGRRIDLILANEAAMGEIRLDSAFVLGTTAAPEGVSWDDARLLPGYGSDHYPVAVDIDPKERPTGG